MQLDLDKALAEVDAVAARIRAKGFDMQVPPLMRLDLFLFNDTYTVLWSYHHILLDGWSIAIVIKELASLYESSMVSSTLTRVPPYSAYIEWLSQQPIEAAKAFWTQHLAKFEAPTPLPMTKSSTNSKEIKQHAATLPESVTAQLMV